MSTDFFFGTFPFFSLKMEVKLENMSYLLNLTSLNLILEHTEVKSPRWLLDRTFRRQLENVSCISAHINHNLNSCENCLVFHLLNKQL